MNNESSWQRPTPRAPVRQRFRYAVDNALTHGIAVVMLWVLGALLVVICTIGAITWLLEIGPGNSPVPLLESIWLSLTRSLDPGTFGADTGHSFRFAMLLVTLFGVFAVALIIGLVSNAIDRRLDGLRRGKSLVIESGHSLILGFSSKLPIVIRELVEANSSVRRHAIVVLSSEDKVALEELLQREVPHRGGCRIIVRRGEPSSVGDLSQVRPETAKGVVVLRPEGEAADAEVIKVAMAVTRICGGHPQVPLIVEFDDADAARALRQALPDVVTTVVTSEVVARVAAQTLRQSGLGTVYQEVMDFSGSEFYLVPAPSSVVGRTFGEVLQISPNAMLLGLESPDGMAKLCPSSSTVIREGDQLVMLGDDDASIRLDDAFSAPRISVPRQLMTMAPRAESTLLLNWNAVGSRLLEEIARRAASGSRAHVVSDYPYVGEQIALLSERLTNLTVTWEQGDTIRAEVVGRALEDFAYDHVVVLCAYEGQTPLEADARALLTLMHVRHSLDARDRSEGAKQVNVVTEVMESQAVELAEIASPDDFIVSQRLVSLLIAQLAEKPLLKSVLYELLDSHGAQVAMIPMEEICDPGTYTCADLVEEARALGLCLLGWRTPNAAVAGSLAGGIRMNPTKNESVTLSSGDSLIVFIRD